MKTVLYLVENHKQSSVTIKRTYRQTRVIAPDWQKNQ